MSNWPYPHIVAHRGGGKLAPENTLAAIDVGARYGHTMIEFDAKLSKDGQIFIEIKPTTGLGPQTGNVVALAARDLWQGMAAPLLSSFEIDALEAAQEAAPELPRGLLLDEWRDDWRELTTRLGCVSIHLNHKLLDAARVASLKQAGLHILVYTVNKPQRAAELLRWGVDCICTDAIDVIGPNFHP